MAIKRYPQNIPDYPVEINYNKDEKSYIAKIPDLQYCIASGDTPEMALEELQISLKSTINEAKDKGERLPQPRKFTH
ncbi:MAG: type II toxin-antitoxin system HicB family antitoxin [Candidatus Heimdallarchaeota archaeon]|nr:type II toxin-antitoxin system HicB family antitoxin [Candidatus Heimdallarchaeota archaeon]